MHTQQVAKILEISGIVIGTGLGTILLNRQMVGRVADRITSAIRNLSDRLTATKTVVLMLLAVAQIKPDLKQTESLIAMSSASITAFTMMVLTIIGKLTEVPWLFWFGMVGVGLYALATIIDTFIQCRRSRRKNLLLSLYPFLLLGRMFSGFVVSPTMILLFAFLILLLVSVEKFFNLIAREDIFRRGLIRVGFILVLIGLVLELIVI